MISKLVVLGCWVFLVAALFAAMATVPMWFLWNWLLAQLFGFPEVTILEAFGLLLLSGFLFSGRQVKVDSGPDY